MVLYGLIPERHFGNSPVARVCIRYNVGDLFGARSGRHKIKGKRPGGFFLALGETVALLRFEN